MVGGEFLKGKLKLGSYCHDDDDGGGQVSSTPTVSEEVEVAEALFDLARTIPPLPALDRRIDLKPESKPESKPLPSASVQTTSSPAAQPSNGTAASSLVPPPNTSSTVLAAPSPAAPASPVPSPSLSSAAAPPPAEGMTFFSSVFSIYLCADGLEFLFLLDIPAPVQQCRRAGLAFPSALPTEQQFQPGSLVNNLGLRVLESVILLCLLLHWV